MKLDTTKISNFDTLTDEVKAVLAGYEVEMPPPDTTGLIAKTQFDKVASELAEAKKQLKLKQSTEEQAEAERTASAKAMQDELDALRKEVTVSKHKANYITLGYDEKLATETAQAFVDGKLDVVFANQKVFVENVKKAERASVLASAGTPPPAGSGGAVDYRKLISDAQAAGDFTQMAYYTRLAGMESE